MSDEPTKGVIFLGVVDLSDGEKTIGLDLPAGTDPDTIKAAIEAANKAKAEAQIRETKALRELTGLDKEPLA